MRFWKSWLIAKKDMKIIRKRKLLMALLLVPSLAFGIALPVLINTVIGRKGFVPGVETDLISAFGFLFIILAAVVPLYISSYGIVGEKLEKSMEPLLSTPTSEGEILIGKYIGTFIPSILSTYLGAIVYMTLIDVVTGKYFGYYFFPNTSFIILLLVAVPAAMTYAITLSIFVSSKVNNVMSAYQGGGITLVPFLALYVMGEAGIVKLDDTTNILYISLALIVIAVIMYFVSRNSFGRDKIISEWK